VRRHFTVALLALAWSTAASPPDALGQSALAANPPVLAGVDWFPNTKRECPKVEAHLTLKAVNTAINCVAALGTDTPLHLVLTNVGPSGGFGLGVGASREPRTHVEDAASIGVTLKRFWAAEITRTYRGDSTYGEEAAQHVFEARYRAMPSLQFYGLGPSSGATPAEFGLNEAVLGYRWHQPTPPEGEWVLDVPFEIRMPRLTAATAPALAAAGLSSGLPALVEPSDMLHSGLWVSWRPQATTSVKGATTLATDAFVSVRGPNQSFVRFSGKGTVLCDSCWGSLSVTVLFTLSRPFGKEGVPFYYQPTLGGQDEQEGFETLRGFANNRFRGLDRVLGQADYVHKLPGFDLVRGFVFGDVGQVANQRSDFSLDQLRTDFGGGIDVYIGNVSRLRVYEAYGVGQGYRFGYALALGI
jgi:hypothetical protein